MKPSQILRKTGIIIFIAFITLWLSEGCFASAKVPLKIHTSEAGLPAISNSAAGGKIVNDPVNKLITISDDKNLLQLRLNYNGKCMLDDVRIRGSQNIVPSVTGVCSAIQTGGGQWFTTRGGIVTPTVVVKENVVTVSNINYGGAGLNVTEKWTFTTHTDFISWNISRKYLSNATIEDSYFPGWEFTSMNTWTGALLDNGGVAWCKFLETNGASLGQHAGTISLWNKQTNSVLRIVPGNSTGNNFACRFSHQPSGFFTLCQSVTKQELQPKYNLSRYLSDKLDVWQSFTVKQGDTINVTNDLIPLAYDTAYDRGTFKGVNGSSIREMMHTIARYGVIDKQHVGGNGWRSGYICLHEQWWPQIALALGEPDYTNGISESYNYYRDHAIDPDGRVKSRWKYDSGDAMAGTYDTATGFYEAQWGYLMDSQTDYVMVVAEQFQNTGDVAWAQGQKQTCEKVLDYLLKRDTNGNGLVEMMTDKLTNGKSSDWIDIVWSAYENALVNAEMYNALNLWAGVEEVMNDFTKANLYHAAAAKLKTSFNKPIDQGGFWNPDKKWYIYWRDKDTTIHGNNLVMPVNVCAIAYGLCDDTTRIGAILSQMETKMNAEKLFTWPLCFYPYTSAEGGGGTFPAYENGDIFLSWNELAVRAYSKYNPSIALKYIKNILDQYDKDGLGWQRYLRTPNPKTGEPTGSGDDILSGNCMAIAGLYRDIYGVRPLYNGLYLEPHLVAELNGTQLKYRLRNKLFVIDLSMNDYAITVNGITVRDTKPFAVDDNGNRLEIPTSVDVLKEDMGKIKPNSLFERLSLTSRLAEFSFTTGHSNDSIDATLFDLQGRKVITLLNGRFTGHQEISRPLSGLSPGIYMLQVIVNSKSVWSDKVLIKK